MVTLVHLQPISVDVSPDEESKSSFFVMNTHFDDRGLKGIWSTYKIFSKATSYEMLTQVLDHSFNLKTQ
jgi:hypothetical protein